MCFPFLSVQRATEFLTVRSTISMVDRTVKNPYPGSHGTSASV
jgi:hypothetical protein